MQSSQRSTSDATRPRSSLVLTGSAPASYVRVSSAKKRLMLVLPASRMAAFIFSRKCRNASRVCGVSLIRKSYLLDHDFAYHPLRLVDRAVVRHGSGRCEGVRVMAAGPDRGPQHGARVRGDRVIE